MNKVYLVTGASGGIGSATATLLAQQGERVVVHYHQQRETAQQLVATLNAGPGQAIAVQADITNEAGVAALFTQVDAWGTLTGLVNNAGVIGQVDRFENITAERISHIFNVNVTASLLCAREAIKRMSTAHGGIGGSIVNVSSAASRLGSANEFIDYAASKGAIDTFTVGLAKEVGAYGVRVNAVRPGLIATAMHSHAGEPNRVERLRSLIPMQRGGEAHEVASAIVWLLSDSASYVSGALLDVAGGR